jgi:hypothetical protein
MRILLDENIPRGLRRILHGHDVRTASEMGWASIANGQLLDEAEKAGFEALVTSDQNFVFQQNLAERISPSSSFPPTGGQQYEPSRRPCSAPSPTPLPGLSPASRCPAASEGPGRLRT